MDNECAICGQPSDEEVCENCELNVDPEKYVDMNDDDFINSINAMGALS